MSILLKQIHFDCITEGTTGIIEGLYQAAVNQKQQIRNYHTHSRAEDVNKQSARLLPSSLIYAVFTTPQNAIPGSAVCAFQIDDIIDTFEGKSMNKCKIFSESVFNMAFFSFR